ncbi:hypothetical protein PkoCFBP13504_20770 [Pseudomonas koreensis]|nr:hypothetical protein PkoCFBP13504_20770 [Pseudomonas koreensis]
MLTQPESKNFIFIEHDHLSDDYQQQILDLNLRQSAPKTVGHKTISKVFPTSLGDRIIISNPPSNQNIESPYQCEKIMIELISVDENALNLKITLSKNTFEIECHSPAKS